MNTVAEAALLVVPMVQTARINKRQCARMVDNVHQLLCTLTLLFLCSGSALTPKLLGEIGRVVQNLHKFYACLRSQQELGKIKRFFKQSEVTAQLEACEVELRGLLESFKLQSDSFLATAVADLDAQTQDRHQQFLELLASQSSSQYSDIMSTTNSSSSAFSLLPALPQIFNGRESELAEIVAAFIQCPARVAIMGTGGMGKTALALAVLHHPDIEVNYSHKHFVSCEAATSAAGLISAVGAHLGVEQSRALSKAIVGYFWDCGPTMLVLDNLETPWEPLSTRGKVEEFLSLLTDVPHLALLITMRGAERPGKIKWTRPFLLPLEPLSSIASRQIFIDIAAEPRADEEAALAELMEVTGNLPLAVGLMANVASFEGYLGALSRWKAENTALISDGYDKRSSLEKSIIVSLKSPRLESNPQALELLGLLCLLPDGILEEELISSQVPLQNIPQCRSVLLQTSLAFLVEGRLKALPPIREYVRGIHPASADCTKPLLDHFHALLLVVESYSEISHRGVFRQLISHLGNIQSLFLNAIKAEGVTKSDLGYAILTLSHLSMTMLKGESPLVRYLPGIIDSGDDHHLKWLYLRYCVNAIDRPAIGLDDLEALANQGVQFFVREQDYEAQATTYAALSLYYHRAGDLRKALEFNELGIGLRNKIGPMGQLVAIRARANIQATLGECHKSVQNYREAQKLARLTGRVSEECESLIDEAVPWCRLGNFREAQECITTGQALLYTNGLQGSDFELSCLDHAAEIHLQKGEYGEARRLTDLVRQKTSPHRSTYFHANSLATLAQIDTIIGASDTQVLENLVAAKKLATELGWGFEEVICDLLRCRLDIRDGRGIEAYTAMKTMFGDPALEPQVRLMILESLGDSSNRMCGPTETFHWATTYFAFARKITEPSHTYQGLRCLADIFLAEGDEQTALNIFQAVLDRSTEMGVHQRRADCMLRIGNILRRRGQIDQAKEMWEAARPLFVRSSQTNNVATIDAKLADLQQH
ncbi:hypothetical protein DFH09DRAFT_1284466 [Mycena vulgaris]|nr:hypothetical protein DFH09DRAFT_1284466 [Mycena vulgaris]